MTLSTSNIQVPDSHTLWSPSDTIKDASESLGIQNLPDDVAKALAMDVEYRIHEIIEQALKFMKHSKRRTLKTIDIEKSLNVLNIEPLYGYNTNKSLNFKEALVGPGHALYYIDNNEIDFEKLINKPLPNVPRITTFTAHWLAIEGVQPLIPQNPLLSEIKNLPPTQRGSLVNNILTSSSIGISTISNDSGVTNPDSSSNTFTSAINNKPNNNNNISSNINNTNTGRINNLSNGESNKTNGYEIRPLVKHVLSKELQVYFNKVIEILLLNTGSNDENEKKGDKDKVNENTEDNENLKQAALQSLRSEPGLHQLVPYFIEFIKEQVTYNLKNIQLLTTMLEVIYSLLSNETIFLHPYIHGLMPSILTLLLAKKIGPSLKDLLELKKGEENARIEDNSANGGIANIDLDSLYHHISIRDFAASLLDHVIKNYGKSYSYLKPKVARTLLKAFLATNIKNSTQSIYDDKENDILLEKDDTVSNSAYDGNIESIEKNFRKNFGTYYGSIIGITKLGPDSVRMLILGNLKNWSELIFIDPPNIADEKNNVKLLERKKFIKERQFLIFAIMLALRSLKVSDTILNLNNTEKHTAGDHEKDKDGDQEMNDVSDVKIESNETEVSGTLIQKLKDRVGDVIANAILQQKDRKSIIDGIFFAEI
ncbi:TATA-binding protein-associated factor TAF6 ASCRUDRAFT_78217 [Ascoidea rubescens DSM 1968]|uniref:TBP-associated factor 6 n=1 Tax=Ascoidea rubescens DSM 1968 TaxID=1344418 RepID=A0A1D2V969_9ASCO|nr:hypothetical protein ASCRUDRAFT_78217 [Ascoidea rubescens DSM 1968]ODV58109.1 hypothetical protein ASCRUDRAFT_78217 [Ascoidea rubescens DSM 1968]